MPTTIFMKIANESMYVELSQLQKNNTVVVHTAKSDMYTKHYLELGETEIRELRKFLTIQLRKIKQ